MMTNRKWENFYKPLTIENYLYNLSRHRFLFSQILRTNPKKVVEVGIGSGSMSIFLSHLGIDVVGIDNNPTILKMAQENAKKLNADVKFILTDVLKPLPLKNEFDISFSQGVAEHFTDQQARTFIKNQLDISKRVIISLPNKYYYKSFGDERLLGIDEWKKILRMFNISKICYYGIELPSKEFALKKILSLRPHHIIKPHHIFIEIQR